MSAHYGYGGTAGNDALVFAYDTGDTLNSYKGEPTTNLADTDAKRSWGTHSGATSTTEDAPEKGPGWKKLIITDINGNNYRLAQFPYLTQADGTARTYSVEYDLGNLTGYKLFVDGTNGYPQTSVSGRGRYSYTIGPVSGNKSLAIFLGKSGTYSGINDVIYYKEYQVEEKSHATPFTEGTRSATQGLLDLTGNSTIDLTNVSFDSDAQMTFDGTNDYIAAGTSTDFYFDTGDFTLEAVFTPVDNGNAWTGVVNKGGSGAPGFAMSYYANGNGTMTLYMDIDAPDNIHYSSGLLTSGNTYHIVMVYDRDSAGYVYNNGTLTHTHTGLVSQNQSVNFERNLRLGTYDSSQWFMEGEIHITKIYNRALSAAEVKQNYNNYRGRFNL
jgi:hypothetical protein